MPLVYLSPHQPASEVFGTFLNVGDWSSTGLAIFVGLVTCSGAFVGECEINCLSCTFLANGM